MKRLGAIALCLLFCISMAAGCAKNVVFEKDVHRFTYDSNLWTQNKYHYGVNYLGLGISEVIVLLPATEKSFAEQKMRINGRIMNMMDPNIGIYEYPLSDGVEALDGHFERLVMNENDTYPSFTFNGLVPVAQRQCEVRINFGENDYETCYMCAFNTDGGSIVIECEYISDKTWSEMQKILNTLEIF